MVLELTKFNHSCVMVKDDQHTTLFDPGVFTWQSGLVHIENWPKLDYVLITHQHPDHFSEDFIKAIIAKFPDAKFISNSDVVAKLQALGVSNTGTESTNEVEVLPWNHDGLEPLGGNPPCKNVGFHYKGLVTHPGDTINFSETKPVLLLPLAGPWERPVNAAALGEKLHPRVIVPIHDWMWKDQWRDTMHSWMAEFFPKKNINFITPVNGQSFKVDV